MSLKPVARLMLTRVCANTCSRSITTWPAASALPLWFHIWLPTLRLSNFSSPSPLTAPSVCPDCRGWLSWLRSLWFLLSAGCSHVERWLRFRVFTGAMPPLWARICWQKQGLIIPCLSHRSRLIKRLKAFSPWHYIFHSAIPFWRNFCSAILRL